METALSSRIGRSSGVAAALALAASAAGAPWPTGSSGSCAWLCRPSGPERWVVVLIDGLPPTVRAHAASRFTREPEAIAGDASRAVVVLRADTGARGVRQIHVARQPVAGRSASPLFSPAEVLAPLPAEGLFRGLALWGEGAAALIEEKDGEPELHLLRSGRWEPSPIPTPALPINEPRLIADGTALVILGTRGSVRAEASSPDATIGPWTPGDLLAPPGWQVASLDSVPTLYRTQGGAVEIAIGGADDPAPQGRIERVPRSHGVVGIGGQVLAVWEVEDGTLHGSAVSALGAPVWSGALPTDPPVSKREVANLIVGLGSLLASVGLWVGTPAWLRRPITPPDGYTYAGTPRRAAATLLDLLPGWLALEGLLRWLSWVPAEILGPAPLVVMLGVTVLLAGLGEAIFGRSLGKWLTGCRTFDADGHPPAWWRALGRTAAKYVCAPLLVLNAVVPPWKWTHPAALGTVVVRKSTPMGPGLGPGSGSGASE